MNPFDWSLPLGRIAGIRVRAHWTLLVILAYDAGDRVHGGTGWAWWALMSFALLGSVLLHELGHAVAARSVGGDCRRIDLWMLGGLAACDTPMRAWPQFAVAVAGPLVNAVIAAVAYGASAIGEAGGWLGDRGTGATFLGYLVFVNLRLLCFNLLPVYPLDGGQMLRSALWPMVGLRRATFITILVAYPCAVGVLLYGGWHHDWLWCSLGVWMVFRIVQEHTLLRLGELDQESWLNPAAATREGWFARWRRERARKAHERREREEQAEQEQVDRLLAKVSEHGLASLTKQERSTLEAYSRKQRERQELAGKR